MRRVASLYLPPLAIERLRRSERLARPPEAAAAERRPPHPPAIDEDPGSCSVPRGGGWRPGARWAREGGWGESVAAPDGEGRQWSAAHKPACAWPT